MNRKSFLKSLTLSVLPFCFVKKTGAADGKVLKVYREEYWGGGINDSLEPFTSFKLYGKSKEFLGSRAIYSNKMDVWTKNNHFRVRRRVFERDHTEYYLEQFPQSA